MTDVTARAATGFYHGKNFRRGDPVTASAAVIDDLERKGLVSKKAAPTSANKRAPEPENKARAK